MKRTMIPLLLVSAIAATAQAAGNFQFSTGVDYAQGKYGSANTTEQTSIPLLFKFNGERLTLKASLPYVYIRNVNPGAGGEALPCGNAATTPQNVDGFGDLVTTGMLNVVRSGDWLVDVGGKIKWGTGDADKCLSTGKNDFSAMADISRRFGLATVFGIAGWTKKGDPTFNGVKTDYRDPFFGTLGLAYKLADGTSVGASYDYRARLRPTSEAVSEATVFMSHRLSRDIKMQVYAVSGFTNASPDLGGGALVSTTF